MPNTMSPPILMLLSTAFVLNTAAVEATQLTESNAATCGACRCIPPEGDPANATSCPWEEGPERHYKFKPALIDLYKGFQLNQEGMMTQPVIQDEAGNIGACFAFGDELKTALGLVSFPNCDTSSLAGLTADSVCGYVFDSNPTDGICAEKTYRMETFANYTSAVMGGATVSHYGGCGVCSNAQDTATLLEHNGDLEELSYLCGVDFNLQRQEGLDSTTIFTNTIQCFENIGFTSMCSVIRTQYLLANAGACRIQCAADQPWAVTPNDPDTCEKNPCIQCTDTATLQALRAFAGREQTVSGIITNIAQPCDQFPPLNLDPCPGTGALDDSTYAPSSPPNEAPSSSGFYLCHARIATAFTFLLSFGAVWLQL